MFIAQQAGHSWATIRRVQKTLEVTSKKDCGVYFWYLPILSILSNEVAQNSFQESQVAQNSFSGMDNLDTIDKCLEINGLQDTNNEHEIKIDEVAQIARIHVNFEQPEQPDDFEQKPLNNVLNSNIGDTDENGRHKVKAQRRPKGKTQQQLCETNRKDEVTPCDKQQDLF